MNFSATVEALVMTAGGAVEPKVSAFSAACLGTVLRKEQRPILGTRCLLSYELKFFCLIF